MDKAKKLHQLLVDRKKSLALAESCSGGHLAARFTSIPDASSYFLGSLITYSNALKERLLHVSRKTLDVHGAVSRETANEMLLGLMKETGADYGAAVTGIAGPKGGGNGKPIGTVYIAVAEQGKKPHVVKCHFEGDRQSVIEATCDRAVSELTSIVG